MAKQESPNSEDPIFFRYADLKPKEFTPAIGDYQNIEAISNHIEKHIGKIESVYHEIISDLVHIDVHWVKPSKKFPFHTLVTSGMSDRPMNVPEEFDDRKYAELCVLLPKDWQIDATIHLTLEETFIDENGYWPVHWLKFIARLPHQYDTWVGHGHTISNGEDVEPLAENTKLCCMFLYPSITLGKDFFNLKINEHKTVKFYCLYPLYKEEMDFKLKNSADALIDKFEKYNISDVIDINRRNTCVKKGFLGLW